MMTERILKKDRCCYRGSPALWLTVLLCGLLPVNALGQLGSDFEFVDGNAIDDPAVTGDDWDVTNATGGASVLHTGTIDDLPQIDPLTGVFGETRFTVGTKDILDIDEWGWDNHNPQDKDDITNAYAALYDVNYFYFGSDRYATNGDSQIGFWLFKSEISRNPDGTFTGLHEIGDILVLADFVQGGSVPIVPRVFRWVGSGGSEGTRRAHGNQPHGRVRRREYGPCVCAVAVHAQVPRDVSGRMPDA